MYKFGSKSQGNLDECHIDLQKIANEVIKAYDFTVYEGRRDQATQDKYYHAGKSKLKYPKSKHNKQPSMALDCAPYPIDWNDKKRFYYLAGAMKQAAVMLKAKGEITHTLRWGGDWDMDGDFKDQSFEDLPHFELRK